MDESSHSFLFVIQTRKIGNLVSVLTQDLKLQKVILIFYIIKIGQTTLMTSNES